jgi:hypothetical protein
VPVTPGLAVIIDAITESRRIDAARLGAAIYGLGPAERHILPGTPAVALPLPATGPPAARAV